MKDALPRPERKYRRCVAVGETKANLGKAQLFVWAARDVDSKEVFASRCSFTRSSLVAELLLKMPSNTLRISHSYLWIEHPGTKMP